MGSGRRSIAPELDREQLWRDPEVVAGYRSTFRGEHPPVPVGAESATRRGHAHATRTRLPRGPVGGALGVVAVLAFVWWILVAQRHALLDTNLDDVGASVDATLASTLHAEHVLAVITWVVTVVTTLILGGIIFRVFIAPEPRGSRPSRTARTERTLRTAALVGIAAVAGSIPLRAIAVSGDGLLASMRPENLWFVVTSSFGNAAVLRIAGLAVVLLAVSRPPDLRIRFTAIGPLTRRRLTYLAATGLVLWSYTLVGHPQATEPRQLLMVAQSLHVLAASVWFGGLTFLTLELYRPQHHERVYAPAQLADRFSTVAGGAVALAAVTGIVLTRSQISSPGLLVSTGYGRALLIKLGLVVAVLGIGAYNHRRVVPAITRRLRATAVRHLRRNLTELRRTGVLELSLMAFGILLMTAAMVTGGI